MTTIREKIHFCQNALRNETISQQFGVTEDAISDILNSRFLQPIIVSLHGIQQAVCLVREQKTVIRRVKTNLHLSAYVCFFCINPYFAQTTV